MSTQGDTVKVTAAIVTAGVVTSITVVFSPPNAIAAITGFFSFMAGLVMGKLL